MKKKKLAIGTTPKELTAVQNMRSKFQIILLSVLLIASCQDKKRSKPGPDQLMIDATEKAKIRSIIETVQLDCYQVSLKWNSKDSTFRDTLIELRNFQLNDSSKRIVCNRQLVDLECEKLIWKSKYIAQYLKYLDKLNKFSILSYSKENHSKIVARFYLSDKTDLRTVEVIRFLISNHKIEGINILPGISDEFVPIEEYGVDEFYHEPQ